MTQSPLSKCLAFHIFSTNNLPLCKVISGYTRGLCDLGWWEKRTVFFECSVSIIGSWCSGSLWTFLSGRWHLWPKPVFLSMVPSHTIGCDPFWILPHLLPGHMGISKSSTYADWGVRVLHRIFSQLSFSAKAVLLILYDGHNTELVARLLKNFTLSRYASSGPIVFWIPLYVIG